MNRIYRLVWCRSLGALVVASELASSKRKPGGSHRSATSRFSLLLPATILTAIGLSHMSAAHAQSVGDAKLADLQSLVDKYDDSHPAVQAAAHVQIANSSLLVDGASSSPAQVLVQHRHRPAAVALHDAVREMTVTERPVKLEADAHTQIVNASGVGAKPQSRAAVTPMPSAVRVSTQAMQRNVLPVSEAAAASVATPGKAETSGLQPDMASDRRLVHATKSKQAKATTYGDVINDEDAARDEDSTSTPSLLPPAVSLSTNVPMTFSSMPQDIFSTGSSFALMTPSIAEAVPVVPAPGPTPTGLIVGNGGVVGTVTQLLGPTANSLFNNTNGYVSNGSLQVSNANFTQGYSTLSALGLPLLNLTPVGTLLTSTGGTVVGGTGINSHLTLLGGVTSGNYIDNINNGAAGGVLGIVLPTGAPAWASTCLNVLGLLTESCWGVNAAQDNQVLVGDGASANGSEEVVIGTNASHTLPTVEACTAFPGASPNDPTNPCGVPTADYEARLGHSVVIGDSASGTADAQTILGANATSSAANSVALGYASVADRGAQTNYTAYGLIALQNSAGEVSIGSPGQERQITNVAAGSALTDAVNVAQLEGVSLVADNSVQYDDASKTVVTLAGPVSIDGGVTGGTKITNLQQGNLSATSTDAVNGAQLYATNSSISNIYDTGTKYFHANSTGVDSTATGADSVAIGTGAVANNADDLALGANSVTAPPHAGDMAFFGGTAAGTSLSVVSIGSPGQERQIQNVAPGVVTSASTDAINGSQLYSVVTGINNLGSSVATSLGGTSTYDTTTGTVTTSLSYGGSNYNSVQNVINALTGGGTSQGIKYFHANSTLADADASGTDSVAVGPVASASGDSSVAMGNGANASGDGAMAFGSSAIASDAGAMAFGNAASATATNALAFGAGASASMANSIALGAGSSTHVGALNNYTAYGLTALQTSLGEVNVGDRQITGVAAGSALTDAVNVAQLEGVGNQVQAVDKLAVKYDADSSGNATNEITLIGDGSGAEVSITNLAAGSETATSTDAVNGSQLWHWTQDTSNIYSNYSLYNDINNLTNGSGGVKYFNVNSTLANSSASGSNSIAIGPVAAASGNNSVAVGNGATATGDNSVAIGAGSVANRDNTVSVGSDGNDRQITNVAAGTQGTDAVNVNQLTASVTASTAGTVRYDTNTDGSIDYNSVTLGNGDGNTSIHNVAAGVANTDAVNVGQLNSGVQQAVNWANAYTDQQVQQLANHAYAGVAAAMAMAGLPQAYEPGKSMAAVSAGSFRGESSMAVGVSTISEGGRWVYKLTGSIDTRGDSGVSIGAGMQW